MKKLLLISMILVCFTGCTKNVVKNYTDTKCEDVSYKVPIYTYDTITVPSITTFDLNFIVDNKPSYEAIKKQFGTPSMSTFKGDTLHIFYGLKYGSVGTKKTSWNRIQPTKWASISFVSDSMIASNVMDAKTFEVPLVTIYADTSFKMKKKQECKDFTYTATVEEDDPKGTTVAILGGVAGLVYIIFMLFTAD